MIKHYSKTNIGLVRKKNEDCYGYSNTINGELFITADGMGGHVGGEVASKLAVESTIRFFMIKVYDNPIIALNEAVRYANAKILEHVSKNSELKGMGTTITILLYKSNEVYIAHVGDSRIYLLSNGKLHRLTRDHSYVQGLVDSGAISASEAKRHPDRNRLQKALGLTPDIDATVCTKAILPKKTDTFLLCSDGLCGLVNDMTIQQELNKPVSLQVKANELISLALNAGGNDNVTLQLIEVLESINKQSVFKDSSTPGLISKDRVSPIRHGGHLNKSTRITVIAAFIAIILIIGGVFTYGHFFFKKEVHYIAFLYDKYDDIRKEKIVSKDYQSIINDFKGDDNLIFLEIFDANYILYFFPIKGDNVYRETKANNYVVDLEESTSIEDSVLSDEETDQTKVARSKSKEKTDQTIIAKSESDEEIGGIDSVEYEDLETYLIEYVLKDNNYNEIVHTIKHLEKWDKIENQYGVCREVIKLFSYNDNTYNKEDDGNILIKGTNQLIPKYLSKNPGLNPKYYKLIESVSDSELVILLGKNNIDTNYRMK